jgi:hypothetical protein
VSFTLTGLLTNTAKGTVSYNVKVSSYDYNELFRAINGYLYLSVGDSVYRSVDDGANWTSRLTVATCTAYGIGTYCEAADNSILVTAMLDSGEKRIYRSTDNGGTFSQVYSPAGTYAAGMMQPLKLMNNDIICSYSSSTRV